MLFFQPASSRRADAAAGRQVLPNITVYPLPASLYLAEARPRTYRKALDFIQHCMDAHSFEEPLLWACTPMAANLMEELPCRGLVYDCDRIWQELPVSWESNLAYRADLILAASRTGRAALPVQRQHRLASLRAWTSPCFPWWDRPGFPFPPT